MKYEDAAGGPVTVEGLKHTLWWCKTCHRIYPGPNGHAARWCCAEDLPCRTEGCSTRVDKSNFGYCVPCTERMEEEKWARRKKVEPEWPCVVADDDRYFFDESDLVMWMEDEEITSVRLEACKRLTPPVFEMSEWLCGYMPEDDYPDDSHDEEINRMIRQTAPEVWVGRGEFFEYHMEE